MKVLIVRHAPAGNRERFKKTGLPDDLRPITGDGRRSMRRIAGGLRRLTSRPDLLASSPFLRAKQTAEILSKALGGVRRTVLEELSNDADPETILHWLQKRKEEKVALVGHEPHLGSTISWLCARRKEPLTELKKGQACLLEFDPRTGTAFILWSLRPAHLKQLAKRRRKK